MQPVWMSMAILLLGMLLVIAVVIAVVLVLVLRRKNERRGFDVKPVLPLDESKR